MPPVKIVRWLPFSRSFLAINLFGMIFSRRQLSVRELNHELIHTAQQRELLYVGFYLWYGIEWFIWLLRLRNPMRAYYAVRFEREAYRHESEPDYLQHRRHFHYT